MVLRASLRDPAVTNVVLHLVARKSASPSMRVNGTAALDGRRILGKSIASLLALDKALREEAVGERVSPRSADATSFTAHFPAGPVFIDWPSERRGQKPRVVLVRHRVFLHRHGT